MNKNDNGVTLGMALYYRTRSTCTYIANIFTYFMEGEKLFFSCASITHSFYFIYTCEINKNIVTDHFAVYKYNRILRDIIRYDGLLPVYTF